MVIICVFSIIIAFIFNKYNVGFWVNIFIGIFSSGVLALILSIIGYQIERMKTLEEFYTYVLKAIANFNRFENNGDPQYTMDIVLKINDFDYTALDMSYGNIDFMFANNTHRKYIYDRIYKRVCNLKHIINDKSFHFKEYKKAINGNLPVMELFIKKIDEEIMARKREDITNEDGSVCIVSSSYNKFNNEIMDELNGKYYKIMYGRKTNI